MGHERLANGVTWTSPPVIDVLGTRSLVVRMFGAPVVVSAESNGVGLFDAWALRYPCGLEVCLWVFREGATASIGDDDSTSIVVVANRLEVRHVLHHLPFPPAPYVELPDDEPLPWQVLRQDDHGNRVEVGCFTSRCEAIAVADLLEATGHKQTYFVRGVASDGRAQPTSRSGVW